MNKLNVRNICIIFALSCAFIVCLSGGVFAIGSPVGMAANKELEKNIEMPVLDGNIWGKMSHDSKMAFLWGVWHVVSVERYLMGKYDTVKKDSFSAKVVEGASKTQMTMNDVIGLVDRYYSANPDQIEKPVLGVIWNSMIKPHLRTGFSGRPLEH